MTETTPEQALAQRAREFGVECVVGVTAEMLDPSLTRALPVEWARANRILPVRLNGELRALLADPAAVAPLEYLGLVLGEDALPLLAPADVVARAIEDCYFSRAETADAFLQGMAGASPAATATPGGGASESSDLLSVAADAPVTQLVNLILVEALKARASDIHVEPCEQRLRVRFRIDGVLYEHTAPPKHLQAALTSRLKVMARMDIAEKRLPQDGVARVRVGEREIDVRVSSVPVADGERVVLRLLNRAEALVPLEDLGMADWMRDRFRALIREPNGILLVTGPTGSGKTTTLYAALRELDASRRNILTIEDPVEYRLPDIGQIQVQPRIGLTFATGLRHILRQDPDVVLVGETRDRETAEIAVRASLTGHLVLTTLHTNDAPGAIVRLVDVGVEPYLIAGAVRAVLAQRLVRRLCPQCRRARTVTEEDLRGVAPALIALRDRMVWDAVGCAACREGYSGRVGLFEMAVFTRELQQAVREGVRDLDAFRETARRAGLRSVAEDGVAKILTGRTSLREVIEATGSQP